MLSIRTRVIIPVVLSLASVVASFGFAKPVRSVEFEPLMISSQETVVPGQPLACAVAFDGGTPSEIHITSNPPGVVSYHGPVSGASDVVEAATSASAPAGPVTVYLATSGDTVVSDTTTFDTANGGMDHPR
jgi:hypothetical protein